MSKSTYIQIGVRSKRLATGEFMPAEPIYAQTTEKPLKSGLTESEERVLHEIAALFASKHFEITAKEAKQNVKI